MEPAELILTSLDVASQKVDDLTPLIYPRFFEQYPEAEIEFGNDPEDFSKGRMLVNLLMEIVGYAEDKVYPGNIRRWISDHMEYGVVPEMYKYLLSSLIDVVRELNGPDWTEATEAAWHAQFEKLMVYVDEAYQ